MSKSTEKPLNQLIIRKSEGSQEQIKLDYVAVKNAAMILRAINHNLRQRIIKLIEENKRMNVTDIYVKLRLEQSVASQHLAILRRANILITERDGKFIHYVVNNKRLAAIAKFVSELVHSNELVFQEIQAFKSIPPPDFDIRGDEPNNPTPLKKDEPESGEQFKSIPPKD